MTKHSRWMGSVAKHNTVSLLKRLQVTGAPHEAYLPQCLSSTGNQDRCWGAILEFVSQMSAQ